MILLNGTEVKPTIFPDNTSQVWHLKNIKLAGNEIRWIYENDLELIQVVQLADLIGKNDTELIIPYLPYARQDKEISNDQSFALHTFAKLLNTANFSRVYYFDVHSNVANKLIDSSCNVVPNLEFVKDYDLVCFPDAGALKRYKPYVNPWNNQTFYAEKVRQESTGLITHYALHTEYQVTDLSVIVVDDLCDGGATFNILADTLNRLGVGRVDLYVSHGLFSKGVSKLLESYNKIVTTNTRFEGVNFDLAKHQSVNWKEIVSAYEAGTLEIRESI